MAGFLTSGIVVFDIDFNEISKLNIILKDLSKMNLTIALGLVGLTINFVLKKNSTRKNEQNEDNEQKGRNFLTYNVLTVSVASVFGLMLSHTDTGLIWFQFFKVSYVVFYTGLICGIIIYLTIYFSKN